MARLRRCVHCQDDFHRMLKQLTHLYPTNIRILQVQPERGREENEKPQDSLCLGGVKITVWASSKFKVDGRCLFEQCLGKKREPERDPSVVYLKPTPKRGAKPQVNTRAFGQTLPSICECIPWQNAYMSSSDKWYPVKPEENKQVLYHDDIESKV